MKGKQAQPRPGSHQGEHGVLPGGGVVGEALHHGLKGGKAGVSGGDAQGEGYGEVAQGDGGAVPEAGAEVGAVIDHSCHNLFQRFGEYYSASGRIVNRLSASPLPTGGRTAPGRAQIHIEKTNDTI